MTVDSLADALLLVSILPPLAFMVLLATRSSWTAELATRTIALASAGTVLFLIQASASVYLGTDYTGRAWIRLIVYGALSIGWAGAVLALLHYQKRGRG